jgi:recombination protein RecA
MGDSHVGLQARLMSQALRKLAGSLHRSNTAPSSSTSSARRSA